MNRIAFLWLVCVGVVFPFFGSSSWAGLVHSMQNDSVASFFMDSPARIEQYDLSNRQWLPSISLPSTYGLPTAGWVDADGIYVAYDKSAYRYDLSGNNEVHLTDVAQKIFQIFSDGNILLLNRTSGHYGRVTSINKDNNTVIAKYDNYTDALFGASLAPSVNKIFGFSIGLSPANINYVSYNADGEFPSYDDHWSPGGSQTWVFPDDAKVVDNSGRIYSTENLTYLNSFDSSITDLKFYGGEIPILLHGDTLTAYSLSTLPTGSAPLDHSPNKIYIDQQDILTFTLSAGFPHGIEVRTTPLSALNPPTPGEPIDPVGLPYTPDDSFIDKDGILCLFSKANQSIFRWDTFLQQYTNSIPLVGVPDYVAYSASNHVVYTAYASGLIREINLDDTNYTERAFTTLLSKPEGLSTAGSYVFAADSFGSIAHRTFAPDGTRIEGVGLNYYSSEYVWSEANQKMYFFRDGISPNDLLWEEINADGTTYPSELPGGIGAKKDSPLHSSTGFSHPIRVAPDGSIVVLGSGVIHDAGTLARLATKLTNSVSDMAWIGNDIYTVRTIDGATQCQKWMFPTFEAGSATNYQGTANRLISMDETSLVSISVNADGVPSFHVMDSGFEELPRGRGALSLEILQAANEGDGVLPGAMRLTVSTTPASNLVVNLTVAEGAEFSVPEQITIPAGENSIDFDLTVFDDTLLDGSRGAMLHASNHWYQDGVVEVLVHDDETATMTLSLPQTTFEGAGTIAGALMVDPAPDEDVIVELVSNNPSKIVSRSIVLPAGQGMVSFTLDVVDDNLIDGVQSASVSAQVLNWTGSRASIFIFDNETTVLGVQVPGSAMEGDGVLTSAGTVSLSGVAISDIHVSLASSDISEAVVPASVMIPKGQSSASFDITVVDDEDTDGMQTLSISAQTPGFVPSSDSMDVLDNDLYAFSIDGLATNQPVLDPLAINITSVNIDGMPLTWFTGTVSLVATGDGGAVDLSPVDTTNFIGGTWSGDVVFSTIANNVTLTVDDGAGHSGTSTVFNVIGSQIILTPDSLTNTLVVAGETITRTMVISNAGNVDLEFIIQGGGENPADPSLMAHFPFNGNADDESGNGHDGTVVGATLTADRFGNADSAYDFNGSSSYINCGNIINGLTHFTVSAWASINSYTHVDYVGPWGQQKFVYEGAVNGNYSFFMGSSYRGFGTSMRWDDGVLLNSRVRHVLPYNEWHLITQTYDGNEVRQYDNGDLLNSVVSAGHTISNTFDFIIGKTAGYPGYLSMHYFDGQIDDLRIYNRALPESEIQELYSETDGDGLVAHFPFNGNADDESGSGYDGTVIGATLTTDRFGNANSAYHFDGANDYIDLGSMDGFKTVSMWVKQGIRKDYDFYFGHNEFRFYASSSENGRLTLGSGIPGYVTTPVHMDSHVGEWIHVVGISDGVDSKIYFNGTNMTVSSDNITPVSSGIVNLGRWPSGTHYFNGDLDDIRVYDRILSESEISDLYNEEGDAGLVAHFPFNGNANDESGNGHNGSVLGATLTTDRFENPNSAYHFDGTDDLVTVIDHADFTVTNVTIAAWIKTADKSDYKHITSCYGTGYNSDWYNLYLTSGSGLTRWAADPGGNVTIPVAIGTTDLADDRWHLVVGVRDTSTGQLKVYVDGVLESTAADIYASVLDPEVDFWIGGQNGWPARYFNGDIDDVRIYSRALSASEIMELYLEDDDGGGDENSWLVVDPKVGTVSAGSNVMVAVQFNATGMVAGDYLADLLKVTSNDVFTPSNSVPASMWVLPPAPAMVAEPEFTAGTANEVAWSMVDGPVSYLTEVVASTNAAPLQQSGWISSTNHTFGSLTTNVVYYYHVKASVSSGIGLLESSWSDWVQSTQVISLDDLDGDLMPDWWEQLYFGSSASGDPLADGDGDGQNNRDEFIAGMDPTDPYSSFMVRTFDSPTNGLFVISWDAVTGRVYSVYWKTNLPASFQTLETEIRHPQNSYTDSVHNAEGCGFYELGVELDQ